MSLVNRMARSVARLMCVAVLTSLLSAPGSARADENWDAAQSAFGVCLQLAPDVGSIRKEFKKQGWRLEGDANNLRVYTKNGYRAVAATQSSSGIDSRCAVSSSKLPPETAIKFASAMSKKLKGAKPIDLTAKGMSAAWEGTLRGKSMRIGVFPNGNFGVMRGAIIMLGEF